MIGIVGSPGVGKSTAAALLVDGLGADAVTLPMDGFHLANAELHRLGRSERKGAPDTFDVDGFVAVLSRLRAGTGRTVYAPRFHREIEESIAADVAIAATTRIVIVEGNYLLLDSGGWEQVRPLLDTCWYLGATSDVDRVARLTARHVAHGRSPQEAATWVERSDERNARLIEQTCVRADLVIALA